MLMTHLLILLLQNVSGVADNGIDKLIKGS